MTTRTRSLCLLISLGLCFSLACSSDDDNPTNVNIPDPEAPRSPRSGVKASSWPRVSSTCSRRWPRSFGGRSGSRV